MIFICPTEIYEEDPEVVGCGCRFDATPDPQGYVQCPECDMEFLVESHG